MAAFHVALPTDLMQRTDLTKISTAAQMATSTVQASACAASGGTWTANGCMMPQASAPSAGGAMSALGENGPLILVGIAAAAAIFFFSKPAKSEPAPAAVAGYRSRRRRSRR